MSTTSNNNTEASSNSSSASLNSDTSIRFFRRVIRYPLLFSDVPLCKRVDEASDTEDEDKERADTDSVHTDYQLSDTLLDQYKPRFYSSRKMNVAPFGTPEGITASSTLKNNDADLFIVEKRINDTLKPLLLMLPMTTNESTNFDVASIRYLAESAIILAANAQASLGRVRRNNISKEIYGSEVLQPSKIKDTPKMFDETETELVRKLAKSFRKNKEAKQSLLKLNSQSKSTFKKSGGSNTNGNSSSNSKSSSGINCRSKNFNGSSGSVTSGSNSSKSASVHNPTHISIPEGPKSECITKEVQDSLLDDAIEQLLPNQYLKLFFYSNLFTVPKPGTNLLRPVLQFEKVKYFYQESLHHVLIEPNYRDLFLLGMLRELNVSVIAYFLIVGATKEECLSNLDKTIKLLVKLVFKFNLEKREDHQHMVIPVVSDSIEHVIESSSNAHSVNDLPSTMSESKQLQAEDSNRQHNNSFVHQSPRWSNPGSISPLRTALEAVSQEKCQLDWRAHSRILQCQSRPPQPSCRIESQVIKGDQELKLSTQKGVQSY
ncbi:hypothetical protein ACTFIU_009060 [Dictyostelium citrinum]